MVEIRRHDLHPAPREPNGLQVLCTRCEKHYPSHLWAVLEPCRGEKKEIRDR